MTLGGQTGARGLSSAVRRRTLLQAGAAGLAAPALLGASHRAPRLRPRQVPRFAVDLPVPPVLSGRTGPGVSGGLVDRYVLTQRPARLQLLPPGLPATPVWAYDGVFPGPTIAARRGRPVEVRQVNRLPQDVSVHLHGHASRPEDDGHPAFAIPPGGQRRYVYANDQRAATLWYHDHADMLTSPHVYRGLAGLYLLSDPEEDRLGLPEGPFDVPLVLQDRIFDVDGRMVHDTAGHTDLLGDVVLVNGAAWPRLAVQARRYRFRILVASNSRPFLLGLSGGRPLSVIAGDAGLLPRPVTTRSLLAAPAERYEVVIDFSTVPVGTSVTLVNQAGTGPLHDLVRFDVVRRVGRDASRVPARLGETPALAPVSARVDRVWRFGRTAAGVFVINGRPFGMDRIDARPRLGRVEVWSCRTEGFGFFHPVHPHLVHLQVLSRDGRPPAPYERGWKDTVFVGEGSVVRVAARFAPHAGRYVLHCHNLVHEDHSMMTNFEVVRG